MLVIPNFIDQTYKSLTLNNYLVERILCAGEQTMKFAAPTAAIQQRTRWDRSLYLMFYILLSVGISVRLQS